MPSLIAGPHRTHPKSQNESASETGIEMKLAEAKKETHSEEGAEGQQGLGGLQNYEAKGVEGEK